MSVIDCIIDLLIATPIESKVLVILLAICCIIAVSISIWFIISLLKTQASTNLIKTSKRRFDTLMITTVCILSIAIHIFFFVKIIQIHFQYPFTNINYNNICIGINLDKLYFKVYCIFVSFVSLGYILSLSVYYYRLILTFDQTVCQLSETKKRILKILMVLCIIITINIIALGIIGQIRIAFILASFLLQFIVLNLFIYVI